MAVLAVEARCPLLDECGDAFAEIRRVERAQLRVHLHVEDVRERTVQGGAQRTLGVGDYACRLRRDLTGHAAGRVLELIAGDDTVEQRSEEHTSELQASENLVCRLL